MSTNPQHWQPDGEIDVANDQDVLSASNDLDYELRMLFQNGDIINQETFSRLGEIVTRHVIDISKIVATIAVENGRRDGRW